MNHSDRSETGSDFKDLLSKVSCFEFVQLRLFSYKVAELLSIRVVLVDLKIALLFRVFVKVHHHHRMFGTVLSEFLNPEEVVQYVVFVTLNVRKLVSFNHESFGIALSLTSSDCGTRRSIKFLTQSVLFSEFAA